MMPASLASERDEPPESSPRAGHLLGRDTVRNPLPWFLRALEQPTAPEAEFVPDESGVYPAAAGAPSDLERSAELDPEDALAGCPGEADLQSLVDEIAFEEERRFRGHGTTPMDDQSPDDELDAWAMRCGRLERAARLSDQSPNDADRLCDLAEARLGLDAPRGAEADASRAIALDPRCARAYVVRATVKTALGDHQGGLADCQKALNLNPRSVSALERQARIRTALDDHAGAVVSLDLAIALCSRDHVLFKTRARARALAGDLTGACEDATIAVAMAPRDGEALVLRGMLRRAGGLAGASSDLRRALSGRATD